VVLGLLEQLSCENCFFGCKYRKKIVFEDVDSVFSIINVDENSDGVK
jgi:hypothetical protein